MSLTTSELLTLLLALYGAIVSTVLAIRELSRDKRRLRVTCRIALTPSPSGGVWEFVKVNAVNIGHRPIQVKMAELRMSNGDLFTQVWSNLGPLPLPRKLEDGESVSVFFDYGEVERAGRERKVTFVEAVVQDAEGNEYTSRVPKVLRDGSLLSAIQAPSEGNRLGNAHLGDRGGTERQ